MTWNLDPRRADRRLRLLQRTVASRSGSGPMSPNATRFASEMLSKVVNASGSDRRVAMAVFDSIGAWV